MKQVSLFLLILVSLVSCKTGQAEPLNKITWVEPRITDTADITNNFYDNTETHFLQVNNLVIDGEIANPGKVDFSLLPFLFFSPGNSHRHNSGFHLYKLPPG